MSGTDAVRPTVVLFEGESDRRAFGTLARRVERSLDAVSLVDLDGITNLRTVLGGLLRDRGRVFGLYDAAEGAYVARVLHDLGVIEDVEEDVEDAGFFGCRRDLEEEVIRAGGIDLVIESLDTRGDLARFRVFQGQPAQRERTVEAQLHRFAGTASGRKTRFAADVIEMLPIERMPQPLVALLDACLAA